MQKIKKKTKEMKGEKYTKKKILERGSIFGLHLNF